MEPAKGARKEKQQCIDIRTPLSLFNPPNSPYTLAHHIYDVWPNVTEALSKIEEISQNEIIKKFGQSYCENLVLKCCFYHLQSFLLYH